ncbi:MAG: S9 family peptidase [Vulcanimicrobiaceae bacterium]
MRHRLFAAVLCAGILGTALPSAASARPVQAEDLFKIAYVGNPQVSPDGKSIVYVVSKMDGRENRYATNFWLVDVANGHSRQLTATGRDNNPAWAPDSSRFAFTRALPKAKPQIYVYDVRTGHIKKLTALKNGADGATYSHSGARIAFTSTVIDEQPKAQIDFASAGFKPKKTQLKSDVRTINTMHFQANGAGEIDKFHQHIWVMNADGSNVHALTSGHQWSEGNAAWSPDDTTIAFNSLRRDDPAGGPNDIYTIPSAGGAMKRMNAPLPSNNGPAYAHHGDALWYFAGGVEDPAEFAAFVTSAADGSNRREVVPKNTDAWGDSLLADMKEGGGFCGPWFTADDRFMIMNIEGPGYSKLVKMSAADGTTTDLTAARGESYACSASDDGKTVAYMHGDALHPAELYVLNIDNPQPRQLTSMNAAYIKSVQLSNPQPITVKDSAGFNVQAWFMPALSGKPGEKHPTILNIHGGPQTQFGETFFHELQYFAGLGYNVVFSDPRGSSGHGYAFEEALVHHWGDAMFEDTSLVMDEALKRSDVDPARLGVMGGSYGGYATLWVIAHTDRYKAAIAERVVSNLMSEALVADFASSNGLGLKYDWGFPWDPKNTLMEQSPLTYADRVHTPVLILHGTEDTRTPIDQTLQEFSALKILGRSTQFVEFPGENHDLSRTGSPIHRVERLHILSDWMKQHLR